MKQRFKAKRENTLNGHDFLIHTFISHQTQNTSYWIRWFLPNTYWPLIFVVWLRIWFNSIIPICLDIFQNVFSLTKQKGKKNSQFPLRLSKLFYRLILFCSVWFGFFFFYFFFLYLCFCFSFFSLYLLCNAIVSIHMSISVSSNFQFWTWIRWTNERRM